jgi:hypothetical protein
LYRASIFAAILAGGAKAAGGEEFTDVDTSCIEESSALQVKLGAGDDSKFWNLACAGIIDSLVSRITGNGEDAAAFKSRDLKEYVDLYVEDKDAKEQQSTLKNTLALIAADAAGLLVAIEKCSTKTLR